MTRDQRYNASRKGQRRNRRYETSAKGKARMRRYRNRQRKLSKAS